MRITNKFNGVAYINDTILTERPVDPSGKYLTIKDGKPVDGNIADPMYVVLEEDYDIDIAIMNNYTGKAIYFAGAFYVPDCLGGEGSNYTRTKPANIVDGVMHEDFTYVVGQGDKCIEIPKGTFINVLLRLPRVKRG
jgi:hypothetical protein